MVNMNMMCPSFVVAPLSSFIVIVLRNKLAYVTNKGWREISLRKILVISIVENKLYKHMLSSSYLFSNRGKIFLPYTSFKHMPDCLRWSET